MVLLSIKTKIKIIFMLSSVGVVKNIDKQIGIGGIAAVMSLCTVVEKCLSMIHAQSGKKENGNKQKHNKNQNLRCARTR